MKPRLCLLTICLLLSAASAAGGAKEKPVHAQGQVSFGVDMAQRGLWSEALFRFRQAERLGDSRASVLNNIAVAFEALGQFDQAQAYYKKALDQDPRNASLKRNYSRFVEFYQSFKPDQPGSPTEPALDAAETAGDGQGKPLPTTPLDQPPPPAQPGAPANPPTNPS